METQLRQTGAIRKPVNVRATLKRINSEVFDTVISKVDAKPMKERNVDLRKLSLDWLYMILFLTGFIFVYCEDVIKVIYYALVYQSNGY